MNARKRPTAIVVDDNRASAWGLELLLSDQGMDVVIARDGETIVNKITQERIEPDIALCDFHLGNGMNGVETALRLREAANQNVPVIVVSGTGMADAKALAEEHGIPFMTKPVDPEALLRKVEQLVASGGRSAA